MRKNINRNRKAMIIQAAIEIFSAKGFNNSNISDISRKVQIADSTIYEYFKSKEDILLSIPEDGMKEYLRSLERHLTGIKGADNKLRKLIWHIFSFYQNNKDYMAILTRDLRVNPRFYESYAYELIKKYSQIIIDIIEEGKKENLFRRDIDSKVLRSMITGGMDHLILPLFFRNRPYQLMDKMEAFYDILINALAIKKE